MKILWVEEFSQLDDFWICRIDKVIFCSGTQFLFLQIGFYFLQKVFFH